MLHLFIYDLFITSKINKITLAVAVLFCWVVNGAAQEEIINASEMTYKEPSDKVSMITFGLGGMTPQGAFSRKHPDLIFQINLGYLRQIKPEKPLFGGIELGYGIMDQYTADIDFVVEGETETWEVISTSQFLTFELIGRYYLPLKINKLEFFSEFNFGGNLFFTTTTFTPPDADDSSDTEWEKSDFSMKYGIGLGCNFPVSDNIYVHGRFSYIAGLSTAYYTLKPETITLQDSTIEAFDLQKSTTDVLKWDLGVTFAF
jgi:hypothetical protein